MNNSISIITINYNNLSGLRKTFNSLFNQSEDSFEYIVIDGGSTDGSINTITENSEKIDYWISEKDDGIYDAMNKGIRKASGSHLMFLNSGDCLSSNVVIELCLENIIKYPETDIFYGDILGINNVSQGSWVHKHPSDLNLSFFKEKNINHQSSILKSILFEEFGLYPKNYQLAGDHWLFVKSIITEKKFKHINYPLIIFDYSGISSDNRNLYIKEMNLMWNELVPKYVQKLVNELNATNLKMEKKLFKAATLLDRKVQQIKENNPFKRKV